MNDTGYEGGNNMIDYDVNGNMTTMKDKGINSIVYNHLNLPDQFSIKQKLSGWDYNTDISHLYRADGTKLRTTKYSAMQGDIGDTTTTDYLDGFQYRYYDNGLGGGLLSLDKTSFAYEEQAYRNIQDGLISGSASWKLDFVPTAEGFYSFTENRYIYQYKDHLGNSRVSFAKNSAGVLEVTDTNNYYPFGLNHIGGLKGLIGGYKSYKYNGKELQDTGMYDYGARMYMPDLGRWGVIDPKSELLESASSYVYALNSPILYLDKDGELPILINGKVGNDSERANSTYWGTQIINTIKGSGIPNPGGQFHFVDGDQALNFRGELSNKNPKYPQDRNDGGRMQAKNDWNSIVSKLAKDPKSGKITEKIQIYTHSRGAAFGEGYTDELLKMIKANSSKFQDANNVIEFVLDMAPHQSDYLTSVNGVSTYTIDHAGTYAGDPLSDNDKSGVKAAFTTKEGGNWGGGHRISTFANDITAFSQAFVNGQTKKGVIDGFVKRMKDQYNIKVTVRQ